jgi:hypothetical protein
MNPWDFTSQKQASMILFGAKIKRSVADQSAAGYLI